MSVIGVQHLVLASNNRMDKLGNQLHAAGQKVQADVYRQRCIAKHQDGKDFMPAINSESISTPLGTRPRRMSVIGTQHFVPVSSDRIGKLGNHLHAAGRKAQADVYR